MHGYQLAQDRAGTSVDPRGLWGSVEASPAVRGVHVRSRTGHHRGASALPRERQDRARGTAGPRPREQGLHVATPSFQMKMWLPQSLGPRSRGPFSLSPAPLAPGGQLGGQVACSTRPPCHSPPLAPEGSRGRQEWALGNAIPTSPNPVAGILAEEAPQACWIGVRQHDLPSPSQMCWGPKSPGVLG